VTGSPARTKEAWGGGRAGLSAIDRALLVPLAAKYVWWKSPQDAVASPARVIAQVMNIGDHADVESLAAWVGDDVLREVLTHAEAGQLSERSWTYWHYRLGLAEVDQVPPLPRRRLA
jgi:hypothetical protein